MFCGSCMQDNTLARSLRIAGADALLLPTYTPIRVDEENVSGARVFLGGINVYLDSKVPGWRLLPRSMKRWLDRPSIVKWLSKLSGSTNAADLGPLTIDLLRGSHGPQRKEIAELIQYLCDDLRPDVILFSNALLSGIVPELRQRFSGLIYCLLQGDDIFLEGLSEPWKSQALTFVQENAAHFDRLFTHSKYYADFMQSYLKLSADRFQTIPLTIEEPPRQFIEYEPPSNIDGTTIGYFARICPEKGAFRFLEAAKAVLPLRHNMTMVIGGFLPDQHRQTFESALKATQAIVGDRLRWAGSPADRITKFELISTFDWICVPAEYMEPKGLYVLEAALVGVPAILPAHGAFPERVAALGAGVLFDPRIANALDSAILGLPTTVNKQQRINLRSACLTQHSMHSTGSRILEAFQQQ